EYGPEQLVPLDAALIEVPAPAASVPAASVAQMKESPDATPGIPGEDDPRERSTPSFGREDDDAENDGIGNDDAGDATDADGAGDASAEPQGVRFVRAEQETRLARAERKLA